MRTLTTGGGGGSFARLACAASVISFRFLTAAADISGSFGIGDVSELQSFHRTLLGPDKGRSRFCPDPNNFREFRRLTARRWRPALVRLGEEGGVFTLSPNLKATLAREYQKRLSSPAEQARKRAAKGRGPRW